MGIHYGMSFEDYAKLPGVNHSILKHLDESPTKAFYARLSQSSSRCKDVGRAVHCRVLEPEKYDLEFSGPVPGNANSKEHKQVKQSLIDAGVEVLTQSQVEEVVDMSFNLLAHEQFKALLEGAHRELSITWEDSETGVKCKARIDIYNPLFAILSDIKTTKETARLSFSSDFCRFQYDAQMAFYRQGLKAVGLEVESVVIASVASSGAHEVELYTPEDALMQIGDAKVSRWLKQWAELEESGEWFKVKTLTAPQWYLDKHTTEVIDGIAEY